MTKPRGGCSVFGRFSRGRVPGGVFSGAGARSVSHGLTSSPLVSSTVRRDPRRSLVFMTHSLLRLTVGITRLRF